MAHNSDTEPHKRKRDISDESGSQAHHAAERISQPLPPQTGNQPPINYLLRAQPGRLTLLQGDSESFSDVLSLISEYEGVLSRHESLAVNLGAKLTGPRLLKAMEGLFEGPITANPRQAMFGPDPITWLDIVEFSRSHPNEFVVAANGSGVRCCQFQLKGAQVEISEDDWRLIVAGAVDRFRLQQPAEEDETTEIATLDILEQRLQMLIKKADEVARKARQLNYHLGGRKAAINSRRSSHSTASSTFQAVNQLRPSAANPSYDLHADLLSQFVSNAHQSRLSSVSSMPPTPVTANTSVTTPRTSVQYLQQPQTQSLPQLPQQQPHQQSTYTSSSNRPSPGFSTDQPSREPEEEYRNLVTALVEKLGRGDTIYPPCDRCRRLRTQCVKHLTACQGCTKKHARCGWKGITEDEITWLRTQATRDNEEDQNSRGLLCRGKRTLKLHHIFINPLLIRRLAQGTTENEGPIMLARVSSSLASQSAGTSMIYGGRETPSTMAPFRHENMELDSRDADGTHPQSRLAHLPASATTPPHNAAKLHHHKGPSY